MRLYNHTLIVLLHSLYFLYTQIQRPPNLFSRLRIPFTLPVDRIRALLLFEAGFGVGSKDGGLAPSIQMPPDLELLLSHLKTDESRGWFVRFGQRALQTCAPCTSAGDSPMQLTSLLAPQNDDVISLLLQTYGFVNKSRDNRKEKEKKKPWVPDNMSPVLEELPKWDLLADVLQEIEEELMRQEAVSTRPPTRGSNTVLVMTSSPRSSTLATVVNSKLESRDDADEVAAFLASQPSDLLVSFDADALLLETLLLSEAEMEYDSHYSLLPPSQMVVPRFIVMFEPNLDFVRRIEVYRNSNPGMGVRIYFMVYQLCCEEHKYLAGLRREKESFEKLIKERGSMLLPIFEDKHAGKCDAVIKTISTRLAGGRKELSTVASQVIVDMREFHSTLPSLLHASGLLVVLATLTIGDYILTPDIHASLSLKSRRYMQCELMLVHYKHPVLLNEFEEKKMFSLETVAKSAKLYAKPTNKYSAKKSTGPTDSDRAPPSVQSKLVLLILHFPRVRIIWSSSPYGTTDIFNDLKANAFELDPNRAIAIGAEEDPEAGAGIDAAAEELLRCLPGVAAKNVKYVMSKVGSVRELYELDRQGEQGILGVEPGNACYDFMHRGDRKKGVV
ncbi:hypothetical protein CY34DRAFT_17380 [Suillus luteus UH-Slu-Lm8-n1]|uniref:ERCC4 domain-containing protein n=1 Tax=Suillus luteus UH-Slu-Lm8-n1 TaxID=930992 RepID=A0A0D0A9W9_9AGAM|nr:hypothetical protein CY34DRAFT_17380 [Suillus luteus UH-Slu-Lm8-n1]